MISTSTKMKTHPLNLKTTPKNYKPENFTLIISLI